MAIGRQFALPNVAAHFDRLARRRGTVDGILVEHDTRSKARAGLRKVPQRDRADDTQPSAHAQNDCDPER